MNAKRNKKEYFYNNDTKEAICIISAYNERGDFFFVGKAKPTKEDFEFANRMTGLTIAIEKAEISFKEYRIKESKKNINALKAQLKNETDRCDLIQKALSKRKVRLKWYLDSKENFLKRLKETRERKRRERRMMQDVTK